MPNLSLSICSDFVQFILAGEQPIPLPTGVSWRYCAAGKKLVGDVLNNQREHFYNLLPEGGITTSDVENYRDAFLKICEFQFRHKKTIGRLLSLLAITGAFAELISIQEGFKTFSGSIWLANYIDQRFGQMDE